MYNVIHCVKQYIGLLGVYLSWGYGLCELYLSLAWAPRCYFHIIMTLELSVYLFLQVKVEARFKDSLRSNSGSSGENVEITWVDGAV